MSINTSTYHRLIQNRRVLFLGLMIILGITLTIGLIWLQTNHVIAPPGLRLLNGLWKLLICRCRILDGPIDLM